jgi:RND superfamily putative drug exporter
LVKLSVNADGTGRAACDAVQALRHDIVPAAFDGAPATVLVGGDSAAFADMLDMVRLYQPIVIGAVLLLSFVLLLFAFRSLVVAVTAVLMNLLSVSAAYGALTLVFQRGIGAGLLGFQRAQTVEAWVPLLLFCVLFGLSMDYQVFLLSRIRERYDRHGDTDEAVSFGIASTAGIITGAALIMVAVFAGMAAGELVMFQQIGFGLAVAIALDASLVRVVVVPSAMRLLGRRNWYLPRWLEWLPEVKLDEGDVPKRATCETAAVSGARTTRALAAGR